MTKSDFKSPGHDFDGTVRGRLLRNITVPDDPKNWPKYARFEIWGDGRDFHLTGSGSNSLIVEGDVTELVVAGDVITVRDSGAANGSYTAAGGNSYGLGLTTFPVVESVPSPTIVEDSTASVSAVNFSRWQLHPILSITSTGTASEIKIAQLSSYQPPAVPICECDMFLTGDSVRIRNSGGAINDGDWTCRADFTEAGGLRSVFLEGYLNPVVSGSLGQLVLLLPPPQRVVRYGRAVQRWYRAELLADAIVHGRPIDQRGEWYEIIAADIGPDDVIPVEP